MRFSTSCILAALIAAGASPAAAEVAASSESGFVSHNEALVAAAPAEAWAAMLRPADWWNGAHTYSGSAANMTIAAVAGGCFCESVPGANGAPAGQVEHMRVIYLAPGSMLRMTGGLGPLQSEAVTAVLTMALEPSGEGTKITWDLVVGGYMRMPMTEMAPLVDQVVGEQLTRLAASLSNP
jgi:hypothetical protein